MEMNAAGARSLQQIAAADGFSPSFDGVNINRGRALWYRYNVRYSDIVVCSTGLLLGI